jgi:serine/threonine-protein kinase
MEPPDSGPQWIGRYKILGRLGSGGMGEVFLAWDPQLKRKVAIKRILRRSDLSPEQWERFIQEAQLAANVHHPNVVEIYDLLADHEAIVMEYIDGRTLAERLAAGQLETAQILRLALEIASGLEAAHKAGLIHRDLKAANVLITSEGHAKIGDFGLARPAVRPPEEPGLTRKGVVMGTPHAMSPEQVRGEDVDKRSDLFSLGSLCHEMLTGHPPFRGQHDLDSMWKVVNETPVHPLVARPDLPDEVADLLLQLLEKNRDDRPDSAQEVIETLERYQIASVAPKPRVEEPRVDEDYPTGEKTILELPEPREQAKQEPAPTPPVRKPPPFWTWRRFLMAAAVLLLLAVPAVLLAMFLSARNDFTPDQREGTRGKPLRVAVILKLDSTEDDLKCAAATIQSAALRALRSLEKISPIDPEEVTRVKDTPAQIGKAVFPDEILTVSVGREDGMALVTLKRTAMPSSEVLRSPPPFNVPLGRENRPALDGTVLARVREAYSNGESFSRVEEVSDADYAAFLDIQDRVDNGKALPDDLIRLEEIATSSPRFPEAAMLAARIAHSLYLARREPSYLDRAANLIEQARKLAPEDRRPLRLKLQIALTRHDLVEAETILRELERLDPSDPDLLPLRAELAEKRDDPVEASKALTEAVKRVPSWQNQYLLAEFKARQGDIEEARNQLNEIRKQFPNNSWALEKLGYLEMFYGDPGKAEQIYQSLTGYAYERVQSNLATVRVLRGQFPEAEKIYKQALADNPDHVPALINLAEVETALRKKEDAAEHYRQALSLLSRSQAGARLWPSEALEKAQCLARLNQKQEAVAIVTNLRERIDDDPQLLFQSALVLNLAGNRTAARAAAKAALAGGFASRWFSGPELTWLRRDPDFRRWFPKEAEEPG